MVDVRLYGQSAAAEAQAACGGNDLGEPITLRLQAQRNSSAYLFLMVSSCDGADQSYRKNALAIITQALAVQLLRLSEGFKGAVSHLILNFLTHFSTPVAQHCAIRLTVACRYMASFSPQVPLLGMSWRSCRTARHCAGPLA